VSEVTYQQSPLVYKRSQTRSTVRTTKNHQGKLL
jgi:hypothetical protein